MGSRAPALILFIQRSGVRWLIAAVLVYGTFFLVCDPLEDGEFLATLGAKFAPSITQAREDAITFGGVI